MKSVKPGRGPSFMSGFAAVAAGLFGVFWTGITIWMGAWFMAPFGLIFIGLSVVQAIYDFKNATGESRYSSFDIVDSSEEPDPLNQRYGAPAAFSSEQADSREGQTLPNAFCPYCGAPVEGDFRFCNRCGKELP